MSEAEKPAAEGKKGGGKKKLIIVLAAVLLLGGGAGAWFSGLLPKLLGKGGEGGHATAAEGHGAEGHGADGHAADKHADAKGEKAPLFMDLPDIVANLNGGPRRATFVKLKAKLELAHAEDQVVLTAAMPRVLDLFQGYLREMRPDELRGTAGTYRLREELLARTNLAAPPVHVVAVLFTEMLVQ